MKIKRFRAPDMRSVLQQIRSEIGDDAVILATRRVREGGWRTVFGLFGRPLVEVTVAWDDGPDPARTPRPRVPGARARARGYRLDVTVGREPLKPPAGQQDGRSPREAGTPAAAPAGGGEPGGRFPSGSGEGGGRSPAGGPGGAAAGAAAPGGLPPLRLAGAPPLAGVVVAIGPTGAGKTTTLAKLAAHATLERGLQVALVAADTYRLAATAQLEAYAEVLDTELAVAYSAAEVASHVERLRRRADLVLVDTAGRSYLLPEVVREMARVVAAAAPDRVLLVVPAVLAPADAEGLARAVRGIGVTDLVVTKVDETVSPEAVLARAAAWGWPLALVGCGQRVPEDLVVATPESLAPWLGRGTGGVAVAGGGGGRGGAG